MKNLNLNEIIIFTISMISTLLFFLIKSIGNVYQNAFVGAIFELIWLPTLLCIFVMPFINIFYWIKIKFSVKSLYFYGFLISITGVIFFLKTIMQGS